MTTKKSITDVNFAGKRALVRVDFNVPIRDGKVGDDTRIRSALPTIEYLRAAGASLVLCSHLGRPADAPDPAFSLEPVARYIDTLIEGPVYFAADCIGPVAEAAANTLKPGEVLLLENTRFHPGEKKNDPEMARQLARLADIFVNDAFGSAHRAHASTEGVAHILPGVAGFLLQKEIEYLGNAIADPKRPFIAVLGGAKISDKIGVIQNLLVQADQILVGGGMANTFFRARGLELGDSLVEVDALATASALLSETKLHLPVDLVLADKFDNEAAVRVQSVGNIPAGWRILDIGPDTVASFGSILKTAGTIVWNGPMGVFEMPNFARGTFELAKAVAESSAVSIVGGGDLVAAIKQAGLESSISHLSTGGGASLEMLEGKILPGLAALQDR